MERLTPRQNLFVHLLRAGGRRGVTTSELLAGGVGSRYSSRLLELRKLGYKITSERERQGQWRYRLVHEPPAAEPPPVALERLGPGIKRRRRAVDSAQIALFQEPGPVSRAA